MPLNAIIADLYCGKVQNWSRMKQVPLKRARWQL
jgi:hypothetical protein